MREMRIVGTAVMVSLVALGIACGGGGGVVRGAARFDASFVADQGAQASGTVSMAEASVVGDVVTLKVDVTDAAGIYGAAFDITYDPHSVSFREWAPGTLLEQGGNSPNYTVVALQNGTIVVGASRTGNVPGVDAVGSRTLILITFEAKRAGTTSISFRSPSATDDAVPPGEIRGLSWFGGSLVAVSR